VLFREGQSQNVLHDALQSHLGQAREASSKFGIEEDLRIYSNLSEAGQILVSSMQNPLQLTKSAGDVPQVAHGDRVDEVIRGASTVNLNQVGAG
jgi:hypothetical protein